MKKIYILAVAVCIALLLLAWAVFRGHAARELILKKNGLPLANLKAGILPAGWGGARLVQASTDLEGRLDLSVVPAGTDCIALTLWDNTGTVFNGDIRLPARGTCTVDMRGNRTVCVTKRTYADFGLFRFTGQEVEDANWTVAPSATEGLH